MKTRKGRAGSSGVLTLCLLLTILVGLPVAGYGQSPDLDPDADRVLHKMSDYLAGLKQFRVETENSLEVVFRNGEKIQFDNPARVSIQRPDKLRADRKGDIVDQEFFYDGKNFSLHMTDGNYYATVAAPPTIDETIDFARDSLDVYAPGGDLLYSDPYAVLTEDVVSGTYVGLSIVDGARCHHLAFRGNEVDWQIWIEDGDKPLPRKFIITSKWMTAAPQFTTRITNWDLSPEFAENTFTFVPTDGAQKIDFLSRSGHGAYRP